MGHSRAIRYAATLALVLASGAPAEARDSLVSGVSAGKLASVCAGHISLQLDPCGGYIFGATDALADDPRICRHYNPDSGNEQTEAVVLKYLKDHPEGWDKSAAYAVEVALREAFPCPGHK